MKARLALSFPYLCALVVVGLVIAGNHTSRTTAAEAPNQDMKMACAGCGMEVDPDSADFTLDINGVMAYFCGEHCAEGFSPGAGEALPSDNGSMVDPVCGMHVGNGIATQWTGKPFYFCTEQCRDLFNENPQHYLAEVCLVCRSENAFTPLEDPAFSATWQGNTYLFCSSEHRELFRADPAGYFMHTMWGIPNWLYYTSIALVLILSFFVFEWRAHRQAKTRKELINSNGELAVLNVDSTSPRFDLLQFRLLHQLLLHPATRFVLRLLVVGMFVLILVAGLFGNQLPSKNIAPILTWTIWWGGLIILILYAGKAWCYVCPWDAIADWAEGLRFWGKKKNGQSLGLKWPRLLRNIWPATLLFIGLTWIELGFGVTMNPRATAWLGLAMLALTFVCAFIFDRRSFCRYGCLVGRISGLYALFSPVEVRARDREVCRSCRTISCYKGNDQGDACPTYQSLRSMDQNTYCIACMECLRTCEQRNVSLQLRPWGEDLAANFRPRSDEAYLALLMLSLTGFHGLTMTGAWRHVVEAIETTLGIGETIAFSIGMAGLMVAPAALYALLVALSRWLAKAPELRYREYFIRYAYALLPIALFYHLAHNSEHLFMEGQKVVALASDPLGWGWNLFGTSEWSVAPLVNLPTLWIVQVFFVMIGHVYSLWVARRTAGTLLHDSGAALRSQVPMLIAMILFSLMSLWLLKQPMEMRVSAM